MRIASDTAKRIALAAGYRASGHVYLREQGDLFLLFPEDGKWVVHHDLDNGVTLRAVCDGWDAANRLFWHWRKQRSLRGPRYKAARAREAHEKHQAGLQDDEAVERSARRPWTYRGRGDA